MLESKDEETSDSKADQDSKSDSSIVLIDSDKEDFEFIDLSNTKICK